MTLEDSTGDDMEDSTTPATDVVYAGFWRRWAALFLDSLILAAGFYAVIFIAAIVVGVSGMAADWKPDEIPTWVIVSYLILLPTYYVAAALYYSLQESSVHQATLGKRALGIKVTDLDGRRLTRSQAVGRWFAAALSYMTLYIGFLMAAFTHRKQALHDIVANTLVVDRWAYTDHPERQQRRVGVLAVLLGLLMLGIPVLAILAAIAIPQYQQYLVRAEITGAIATAAPLKSDIAAWQSQYGRCPENGDGPIGLAKTYATGNIATIETGKMQDSDHCGIQIILRDLSSGKVNGKYIWLELDTASGHWTCSSDVKNLLLPADCRQ